MGALVAYAVGKLIIHGLNKANTVSATITPERMEQNNAAYREQIGLGKNFKFDGAPLDEYVEARKKSIADLPSIFKDEKLKTTLEDSAIKELLQTTLTKQGRELQGPLLPNTSLDMLDVAQKNYKAQTQLFGELSKKIPPLKVEAVIQTMKEILDSGVKNIEAQQQLEKENLKKLFEPVNADPSQPPVDSPLVAKLKEKGVTDINAAQKSMLAELDTAHKAQLKTFTTATSSSKTQIHQAAQNDFAEINFISSLSADNEKMRELIRITAADNQKAELKAVEDSIAKKREDLRSTTIEQARKEQLEREILEAEATKKQIEDRFGNLAAQLEEENEADPNVGRVHLSDLKLIHSKTGQTIKQNKEGEFTLEIGAMLNPFGSPVGYFMGNKVQHDMNLLAEAVRASGKSSIVMTVNYSNEDMARKRAEEAYRACVNAGYPPEKIAINVNVTIKGQTKKLEWKPEDVFSKDELAAFKAKAEKIDQERKAVVQLKDEGQNTTPVKAELEKLKAAHEAEQEKQRLEAEAKAKALEEAEVDEEAEDELDHGAPTVNT